MNWIDYSTQKPTPEPKRQVWTRFNDSSYGRLHSTDTDHWEFVTHWAEIEEPKLPDPFEDAWNRHRTESLRITVRREFKAGWDAAMKHKEKNETD